ncbi:flippase [Candidatus Pacearchaeota archaeon]|nr:flippase [Candidatus Pacearchaeota archaeon]
MKDEESLKIDRSLKVIVNASFIILLTTFISKILTYLYRIVIARFYGAEIYGVYSISLMFLGWISVFAGLGFAGGLTRYLSYNRGKNEEYKSSFLVKRTTLIVLILGVISCILLIIASDFISNEMFKVPELKAFLIIFSFAIPFSILSGIFFSIIKSYEKIGWFAFIVNIFQNAVRLIAILLLIYLGFNYKSIAFSYVIGAGLTFIISYVVSRRTIPILFSGKRTKGDGELMKRLFSYSWPLIFFGFFSSILSWTDTFMIGILKSTGEVGLYNAALPLALLITLSTDLFRQMFLPLITKEYGKGNINTVKEISRQVTKWLFVATIPLFIALFLFPEDAIRIIFGPEYLSASNSLRILTFGFFIASVLDVSPELLSMKEKSKLILADTIVIVIINIVLNYLLIPKYGINGAALSTAISISILSILFTYQAWKKTSIFIIKRDVIKVLISGLISFAIVWPISLYFSLGFTRLIVSGAVFCISYLSLLYLTNSIDYNDYSILKAVRNKLNKKVSL